MKEETGGLCCSNSNLEREELVKKFMQEMTRFVAPYKVYSIHVSFQYNQNGPKWPFLPVFICSRNPCWPQQHPLPQNALFCLPLFCINGNSDLAMKAAHWDAFKCNLNFTALRLINTSCLSLECKLLKKVCLLKQGNSSYSLESCKH